MLGAPLRFFGLGFVDEYPASGMACQVDRFNSAAFESSCPTIATPPVSSSLFRLAP